MRFSESENPAFGVAMMTGYKIKRAYDDPAKADGMRVLVDRLWPRGLRKEDAHLDHWAKEIAPSAELRRWFGHDPDKWPEFRRRYEAELQKNEGAVKALRECIGKSPATFLFAAKDADRNNAVVLRDFLSSGK